MMEMTVNIQIIRECGQHLLDMINQILESLQNRTGNVHPAAGIMQSTGFDQQVGADF